MLGGSLDGVMTAASSAALAWGRRAAGPGWEEFPMRKFLCPCGYIYDEALGDPEGGVEPGTLWEDVPEDWTCPVCGLPKDAFEEIVD